MPRFLGAAFVWLLLQFWGHPAWAIQGEKVTSTDLAARSVVLILIGNKHTCSGIIYSGDFVLTAAHCLMRGARQPKPSSLRVYYTSNLYADPHNVRKVAKVIINQSYVDPKPNSRGQKHAVLDGTDIAILYIADHHPATAIEVELGPSPSGETTSALPQRSEVSTLSVMGYGFGPSTKNDIGILRRAELSIHSELDFRSVFAASGSLSLSGFSGSKRKARGICSGDSGGGVFFLTRSGKTAMHHGKPVLAGMILAKSGGSLCSTEDMMMSADQIHRWLQERVSHKH